jgi:hypothetical protein
LQEQLVTGARRALCFQLLESQSFMRLAVAMMTRPRLLYDAIFNQWSHIQLHDVT